ncbi:MAG: DUF3581 family protein [Saccharospirillaceae bacterium]|nr:DUF3581 domain-containing protein [Pseudomonadales bacterium]NRB79901.1 DUF3581 family protein [Saccharospirillaceae bacterium]
MFLDRFFNEENGEFQISREQGSSFAKSMANDFNPLHDVDAKKFVVPGDLLFALTLSQIGLYKDMTFTFSGMVSDQSQIRLQQESNLISLVDQKDKTCMSVVMQGEKSDNAALIEKLTKAYVKFSGEAFPHILVPLMKKHNAMINPARPMVLYQSMHISFHSLDISDVSLRMSEATFDVQGKRGNVSLNFEFISDGKVVGLGDKQMLLGGLRDFDEDVIAGIVTEYNQRKERYLVAV